LAFKRLFGSEKNKDILIHFLNDIFGRTTNLIETVTFLKSAQEPEVAAQRVSIVDILCQDLEGNRFIIEMQATSEAGFEKRAQYYAAKTYIQQREKDIAYKDLKEVTFLGITSYSVFPKRSGYLSYHELLNTQTPQRELKDFSFSFLELSKFKKPQGQLKTMMEKWAYFFKYAHKTDPRDLEKIIGSDVIMARAYHELDCYSWSEEEIRDYDRADMKISSIKATNKYMFEQGEKKGLAEGEKKGREEGVKEGMKAGALKML
jgi:predicted transposase/invertase (TIGR01784 family)